MTIKVEPVAPAGSPSERDMLRAIEALNPMRYAGAELLDARTELHEAKAEIERSVHQILLDAEALVGAPELAPHATSLMEICAFGDIVGQRIDKVQAVLRELDDRLRQLATDTRIGLIAEIESLADKRRRELILNGPAIHTAAITQAEIDNLFS
jgi:chemotaxis protein CheZ